MSMRYVLGKKVINNLVAVDVIHANEGKLHRYACGTLEVNEFGKVAIYKVHFEKRIEGLDYQPYVFHTIYADGNGHPEMTKLEKVYFELAVAEQLLNQAAHPRKSGRMRIPTTDGSGRGEDFDGGL